MENMNIQYYNMKESDELTKQKILNSANHEIKVEPLDYYDLTQEYAKCKLSGNIFSNDEKVSPKGFNLEVDEKDVLKHT